MPIAQTGDPSAIWPIPPGGLARYTPPVARGRIVLATLALLLLAFLLDVLTPQSLVAAILFGVPIALSGLALSPRFTWGVVGLALLGDLLAGILNARAEGDASLLAVGNRLLAALSMALVGYLTLALLRKAEAEGRAAAALRRAEALAALYRALDLPIAEPEATLEEALRRLVALFTARGGSLWRRGPGGVEFLFGVGEEVLGVPGYALRGQALPGPAPLGEGRFAFPLGRYLLVLEGGRGVEELALEVQGRLEALLDRARHLSALKELAYAISHDLKTPLAANLLNLRLALQGAYGPLEESFRRALENGVRANEALLRLAENLLALARSTLEDQPPAPLPLKALAEEVVLLLEPLFAERGVGLGLEGEEAWALGQGEALRRALQHLLENALAHAPPGSTVRVRVGRSPGLVRLEVEDEGPGLPEGLLEEVFRRPLRGRGRGLGLYLTRRILEAQGGRVGYRRQGGRTVFYLELEEAQGAPAGLPG